MQNKVERQFGLSDIQVDPSRKDRPPRRECRSEMAIDAARSAHLQTRRAVEPADAPGRVGMQTGADEMTNREGGKGATQGCGGPPVSPSARHPVGPSVHWVVR